MARFVVLTEGEGLKGRSHELKVDKTTVGRVEDNAFQIPEQSVSSHHCEVYLRGNDVVVKDLGSTNGTFINGDKITESAIKPGQILRLGQVELRLEDGQQPAAGAADKAAGAAGAAGKGAPGPAAAGQGQTRVTSRLGGGVKVTEIEQAGTRQVLDKRSGFTKKSNKTTVIFISISVALAVIILVILAFAFSGMGGN